MNLKPPSFLHWSVRTVCPFLLAWLPVKAEIFLAPGILSGLKDEVVEVPIYFQSDQSLVGAEFILEYDPDLLEIGSIQKGSSLSDHEIFDDQDTPGSLKMTILSMTNNTLIDGNLTKISFLLLEDLNHTEEILIIDENETLLVSLSTENFPFSPLLPISDLMIVFPSDDGSLSFAPDRQIFMQADSDGSLASYHWDMGDGTTSEGNSSFYHSYAKPGKYLVTLTASNQFGSFEETFEVIIQHPFWQHDAEDMGYGWKTFDWFGNFFPVDGSNWLYHQELGWLYRQGDTIDNTWLWSEIWGWSWISNESFPYFAHSSGDWIYYFDGTYKPLRFYDYGLTKWLEHDPDNLLMVTLEESPVNGGKAMGPARFYKGENLAFVARPEPGYIFAGWTGDWTSGKNPLLIENQKVDLSIEANFISLEEFKSRGVKALNLSHLSSEQQNQAASEILLQGTSDLVQTGNAQSYVFTSQGNLFERNDPLSTNTSMVGVFNENSASIDHAYFPVLENNVMVESLEQNSKKLVELEFAGSETISSVQCVHLKIAHPNDVLEQRWCAQDSLGNVWLLKSELNGISLQNEPTILLPTAIAPGWKSWSDDNQVPLDYSILSDYPVAVRPLNSSVFNDCALIRLHRADGGEQLEIYARGNGLIKISK